MTGSGFAETGLLVRRGGNPPPTRFQVVGERSSGTNFMKRLLGRNTALRPTEDLGWKHGFCQATAIPEDLAVICMVRAPESWALSMHARPWHCPPEMQALPFDRFLRAPWETVVDRARYFPEADKAGAVGRALQHDRHPLTGRCFASLPELRRAKLSAHLSFLNRGCSVAVVRMEEAVADPAATLAALCDGFGLAPPDGLRPVLKRLGARFKPAIEDRPATPDRLAEADRAFLREQLDPAQEAALGYGW